MPRCSCAGSTCGCKVQGGAGIEVTGLGTAASPYIITATIGDLASAMEFDDTPDVVFAVAGDGTPSDPLVISATTPRKNFPIYPTGGLPDPSVWGEGAFAYDSLIDAPVFSNGTVWKPALALPYLSPRAAGHYISPMLRTSAAGSVSYASGATHGSPLFIAKTITVDLAAIRVSTLEAATSAALVLYKADDNGHPATRVLTATGMDCSTTGSKTAAPSGGSVVLTPGLYWGFIRTNSPGGVVRFTAITPDAPFGQIVDTAVYTPGSNPRYPTVDIGTYAAPADTISAWTYAEGSGTVAPFFQLRRA